MKQAIEGIENHIVKKYKSSTGSDKKGVVAVADTETGEVFKTSFIRQIEVDEDQFAKLYLSNFAAFFDLSTAAIRVFGYILTCMKPKMIWFYSSSTNAKNTPNTKVEKPFTKRLLN